jgi:hypothetical protein
VRIDCEEAFAKVISDFRNDEVLLPEIYVWDEPIDPKHTTPEKHPVKGIHEKLEIQSKTTNTSRNSNLSKQAKIRDHENCLIRGMIGLPNLEACHIYERRDLICFEKSFVGNSKSKLLELLP